jgi:hypothetical protein
LFAVGGAALLTWGITGGVMLGMRSDYQSSCNSGSCDHNLYERAHGLALAADVMLSVGVVAAATAVILVLTRPRERPQVARLVRDLALGVQF